MGAFYHGPHLPMAPPIAEGPGSGAKYGLAMGNTSQKPSAALDPSAFIDQKIAGLGDWRGKTMAQVRAIIHQADAAIVEEVKWMGTPIFSHGGIVTTLETYKSVVKLTFAKGAQLPDPKGLFNSSLDGNVRRAIDLHEGEKIDAAALKALIRAAVELNLAGKTKAKAPAKTKTKTTAQKTPTRARRSP